MRFAVDRWPLAVGSSANGSERSERTANGQLMSVLLGRFFQLIGMIMLPIGLMIGLFQENVALEVRLLCIGGGFFVVGWLMARRR